MYVGDLLQIQFVGHEQHKFPAKAIGFVPDGSVIVTSPRHEGKALPIREGQQVIVRMMSGNNCYAFTTSVLVVANRPYDHLHLAYPKEVESIVVRKALRVSTDISVKVTHPDLDAPATSLVSTANIVDVSTTGGMIECDIPLSNVGDSITVNMRIPVAGVEKNVKLNCLVRSVRERPDDDGLPIYMHGVEYQLLEQMDSILLHGYVYEQLQARS